MLIDTHAHLYLKEFKNDLSDTLNRSKDAGLERIYLPNIDVKSIDSMLELELKHPECIATMGLHPCSVKKGFEKDLYVIEDWLKKRQFVAIGEMGTDLYWDKTHWKEQVEAFKIQAKWAKEYDLPLIIHCRDSMDETIQLIEDLQMEGLRGIFHCFGGTVEQAEKIIKLGFYLGIGGVVTFKKAGLDAVLPQIDLKHLVLETDSPYLAPVPHRGGRNESSYIPIIAKSIAQIKGISIEEVAQATTQNAKNIFKKVKQTV
ncbi:MAG: TatD family hydrolase [Raineya sp.]|jgi:TatD DNase family protein|nr:TatD family hydrolase [Raineya sp.]